MKTAIPLKIQNNRSTTQSFKLTLSRLRSISLQHRTKICSSPGFYR
ncbi:hypothetical protein C8N37_105367 [Sphingobacterium faecium]|nr:hypothetical protein C8N37_105367 [Sphingobacterium faecium]